MNAATGIRFDRISSVLEEQLGSSDVSMRYLDVEGSKLHIVSNEPAESFLKSNGAYIKTLSLSDVEYADLDEYFEEVALEGPRLSCVISRPLTDRKIAPYEAIVFPPNEVDA